jgi:hypothetical protein
MVKLTVLNTLEMLAADGIPDQIIGAVHIAAYKPRWRRSLGRPLKRSHVTVTGHIA